MRWAEVLAVRKLLQEVSDGEAREGGLGAVAGVGIAGDLEVGAAGEADLVGGLGEGVSLGPE